MSLYVQLDRSDPTSTTDQLEYREATLPEILEEAGLANICLDCDGDGHGILAELPDGERWVLECDCLGTGFYPAPHTAEALLRGLRMQSLLGNPIELSDLEASRRTLTFLVNNLLIEATQEKRKSHDTKRHS